MFCVYAQNFWVDGDDKLVRRKKKRECRDINNEIFFKPADRPLNELEIVKIELDEFESLRLCDYEGKNQIDAGEIMNVSRGTIQRLLESGRKKILEALLYEKVLYIKNDDEYFKKLKEFSVKKLKEMIKEPELLKIAFPTNVDLEFENHFGRALNFIIITFHNGEIVERQIIKAPLHGPGVFPNYLSMLEVDVVIVGSIGQRAIEYFKEFEIEILLGMNDSIEKTLKNILEK
ncbi:MAG: DUF134 domain-containing protein [Cetobacterium sp.]